MSEKNPLHERLGVFTVDRSDIEELPDWLQQMMARVIVLKADFSWVCDGLEYTALCPQFHLRLPGAPPLRYRIERKRLQDGTIIFVGFEP